MERSRVADVGLQSEVFKSALCLRHYVGLYPSVSYHVETVDVGFVDPLVISLSAQDVLNVSFVLISIKGIY